MLLRLHLVLSAFALAAGLCAAAQQPIVSMPMPSSAPQPAGVIESLGSLASEPASHTSFAFDRSTLQIAEQIMDSGRAGADKGSALNSVTVDSYRYSKPAFYDPEVMTSIIANYRGAGWKHLVNANAKPGDAPNTQTIATDLWLHFRGAEIDDITVLVRGSREMNMIQVTGALRPLDLIHLSGHFGIPKVDEGAVMVPAPEGK
jgi:hypothetical protein